MFVPSVNRCWIFEKKLQDYINLDQIWNTVQLQVIPVQLFKYHSITIQKRYSINTDKPRMFMTTWFQQSYHISLKQQHLLLINAKSFIFHVWQGSGNIFAFAITQSLRYNFCKKGSLFDFCWKLLFVSS